MFFIRKVDATLKPVLYYISDVMNHPVPGSFYEQQLFRAPKPDLTNSDFFQIDKVVFNRKFKGKKYYFVKFLFYPDKFNKYVTLKELRKRP